MRLYVWLLYIFLILSPLPASAIITYVDDSGRRFFVDDESKIPVRYLADSQNVEGIKELSAEERLAQRERLQNAREQRRLDLIEKRIESAEQERRKLYQTPVAIRGNKVLVPVEVVYGNRSAKLNLLLDTGASRTVLHSNALSRLDINSEEGDHAYGLGVGGYRIEMRMIKFRSITVGPFKAEGAPAYVIEHLNSRVSYDGLLGMDFLRYLSYEIDYPNETIHWKP